MPEKTASFTLPGFQKENSLPLCYGAFLHLKWIPKFAGGERLVGFTKITWNMPHETIIAEAGEEAVTVTSQLPDSASWDLFKKNAKNLQKFGAALDAVKQTATPEKLAEWKMGLQNMQQETLHTLEAEAKENEEVDKVMNLSTGSKAITYAIMLLNAAVFLLMAVNGVSLFEPTNLDIVNWGGNFQPYTIQEGQWWRLLTSTFVHIGLIHLLFNLYALYMVGIYLEPMLGWARYAVAYLCTGLLASLTSLAWHGDSVISAGASGAIFGLYGVFLALLTTKLIPTAVRKALLQSIGIFVVFNLVYGMKAGVDNAAHLGGLVSGFIIGYLYYPSMKSPSPARTTTAAGAVLALTVIVLSVLLSQA